MLFIEAAKEGFLCQHIDQPTRGRGEDKPRLLDIIFTNGEGMINGLEIRSPIRKSYHACIHFIFYYYLNFSLRAPNKFLFNEGVFEGMRVNLAKIYWGEVIDTEAKVNDQWVKFTDRLLKSMESFSPRRKPPPGNRNRRKFITPLDSKALSKIKKNHRVWTRYMESHQK